MLNIKLPLDKITIGAPLFEIASELALVVNSKITDENYIYYTDTNQQNVESILQHDQVLEIVANGGEITNYIMYAELPCEIDGVLIYQLPVPEGLQKRTMKITDGKEIIEGVVKNISQWVNADLNQTFSTDFQKIYVLTNPLNGWLTGSEMAVFVNAFNATLLTRGQYNQINTIE